MVRRLGDVPSHSLLQLCASLAYTLWGLGLILGIVAIVPRVQELKGQPVESLTAFGITAVILVLTVGCIFALNRLNRELRRRLGQV